MARLFNQFARFTKMMTDANSTALHTENEILYRIPIQTAAQIKLKEIAMDETYITLRAEVQSEPHGFLAPVAKSPLDAFRGSGRHSSRQNKLIH